MTSTSSSINPRELLMKGGLGVFAMRIVALGLAFGAESLITRTIGLKQYDLWATAASWLAVLTVICSLGMNTALVRHLPADQAHERFGLMRGMIKWTGQKMFMAGLIIGISFWVSRHLLADGRVGLTSVLAVVAFMFPIQALNLHRQAVLTGLKRPIYALAPDQIIRICILILFVFFFSRHLTHFSATTLAWSWLGSLVFALIIGTWLKWRCVPEHIQKSPPIYSRKDWVSTARPLLWLNLGNLLFTMLDPAMLGAIAKPGEAGLFAIANRTTLLITFGLTTANTIAAPVISQFYETKERHELQTILRLTSIGIAIFTLPAAALLAFFAPQIMVIFGPEFSNAIYPFYWLLGGQTIGAMLGSSSFILAMTGHQLIASRIIWLAAIGKISINFLLMPNHGALGGAISSAIILIACNFWLWIEVRRRMQLEPTLLALLKNPSNN